MSFAPVIPFSGLQGWMYLEKTYDRQLEIYSQQAQLQRDVDYFKEKIGSISSAEELVSDRRLREVALGAFGLKEDMSNIYFVQRVLGDGTASDDALANKLADSRYRQFSAAFGLGPGDLPQTLNSTAMAEIAERYIMRSFEEDVGEQDDSMRTSLYARRELVELAETDTSEETKWYTVLGQPPLRALFETALGLPASFGQADLDRQMAVFRDRLLSMTGTSSVSQFTDMESMDRLITIYQARAQIDAYAPSFSSTATALTLLQNMTR